MHLMGITMYPKVKDPSTAGDSPVLEKPEAVLFGMKFFNTGYGAIQMAMIIAMHLRMPKQHLNVLVKKGVSKNH